MSMMFYGFEIEFDTKRNHFVVLGDGAVIKRGFASEAEAIPFIDAILAEAHKSTLIRQLWENTKNETRFRELVTKLGYENERAEKFLIGGDV